MEAFSEDIFQLLLAFLTFSPFLELFQAQKSGLSPPSPPPKPATHQGLAHAGDFVQFPICQKKQPHFHPLKLREKCRLLSKSARTQLYKYKQFENCL